MTLIKLKKKGRPIILSTKSHLEITNDNVEINTIEALVHLEDSRFKITFVPADKNAIRKCNNRQLNWLRRHYQCEGNEEKILKKMFPSSTVKKKMKAVVKPKLVIEETSETTG